MSLRDELKKARLLSKKDARRLEHEDRVERKSKGRAQREVEQQQHQEELQDKQRQASAETARQQRAVEAERQRHAEAMAVEAILQQAPKPTSGSVRFYFEERDGSLPWLELQPQDAAQLGARSCCIVKPGSGRSRDYRLLDLDLSRRVAKVRPEAIVHAPPGLLSDS
ncbi:MAG: DUF2058 family protein [Planctomycetota bacterium]|nr:DUF2058 family protein [Planctomycetota bacterium]